MIDRLTGGIRRYLSGPGSDYTFYACSEPARCCAETINLYVHIPFCRSLCPYCPYNKAPYDRDLVSPYVRALLNEIDFYHGRFGRVRVSSVYFGGGTPTLIIDELGAIIERLHQRFHIIGEVCIETGPGDLDRHKVSRLREYGVDLLSVGVQSFQDEWLAFVGRKYGAGDAKDVMAYVMGAGFRSVNVDLMFALPGQPLGALARDLETAINCGVDQITAYPLFTFPYSAVGRYLRLKNVRMPGLGTRRRHYYHLHDHLTANGFHRVSVWGFKKDGAPRYSSVTRDNYLGLGAGAGSHMTDGFYLNTFDIVRYIERCREGRSPTALCLPLNEHMQALFWLYWRFYDTVIPKAGLLTLSPRVQRKAGQIFGLFRILGLIRDTGDAYELTRRGAFWVHLAQNYFSLRYINRVWSVAMAEAFPEKIVI